MSDARGIVFAYNQWSYREAAYNVFPAQRSSDFANARIAFLGGKIRAYMQAHPPGVAPLSMKDALDEGSLTSFHFAATAAGHEVLSECTNPFVIRYFPPRPNEANQELAISSPPARITGRIVFGATFSMSTGRFTPRPEPRPATADDPEVDPCEQRECRDDPVWPLVAQPTDWDRIKGKLFYALYTTKWL